MLLVVDFGPWSSEDWASHIDAEVSHVELMMLVTLERFSPLIVTPWRLEIELNQSAALTRSICSFKVSRPDNAKNPDP